MIGQVLASIFTFVTMTFVFALSFYLVYYFIFAKNNFLSKRKVEKKINGIIKHNDIKYEDTKIEKIDGVFFLIDTKDNIYYSI